MCLCALNIVGGQREGFENVSCLVSLFAVALGMRAKSVWKLFSASVERKTEGDRIFSLCSTHQKGSEGNLQQNAESPRISLARRGCSRVEKGLSSRLSALCSISLPDHQ